MRNASVVSLLMVLAIQGLGASKVGASPTPGPEASSLPGLGENVGLSAGVLGDRPAGARRRVAVEVMSTPVETRAAGAAAGAAPNWCERAAGGAPGERSVSLDLSAAHSLVREFGVASPFAVADRALVSAMSDARALTPAGAAGGLRTYAGGLGDVCALPARAGALGPARVEVIDGVAIVTPGSGEPSLPRDVELVLVDLRGLPTVADLRGAVERAVAPAIATPVGLPARWRRAHDGPVDEAFVRFNVYSTSVTLEEQPRLTGTGARDLPLVLLTSERMAPAAAQLAGALRVARRASLLGEDVLSEVAEADWRAVGDHGLAVRTALLDHVWHQQPVRLANQLATQEDPNDPTTTGYRRDLVLEPGTRLLEVTLDGSRHADLDLYLMHDGDQDGAFSWPDELVAASGSLTADERVRLFGSPPPGRYQIWVHGFSVPGPQARSFDLQIDRARGEVWPDVIAADAPATANSSQGLAGQARALAGTRPPAVDGPVARSFPQQVDPFGAVQPTVTGRPELRAALLIAHAVTRLWYPYFHIVGDRIDDRLLETLDAVERWDGTDRIAAANLLRRFGQALRDGHQLVTSRVPLFAGYIPVLLEDIAGRPVVRRSAIDSIHAGDTILAIDGRPIEDVYAEQRALTSAATPGFQFDRASAWISQINAPTMLRLADPDGATRELVIEPQPASRYAQAVDPGASDRPSGPLDDLGAPDLYYINMNFATSPTAAQVRAAIADANSRQARALIVDMRGYPGGDHFEVAQRLMRQPFDTPHLLVTQRTGPDLVALSDHQRRLWPLDDPASDKRIVLLTGPHARSAAENFMQMLVGAHRLAAVVGQRSAGHNGNVTGIQLPGGFAFRYTGMEVRNPDGSTFHATGITPDIEVPLTAADLRDGIDRDLETAINLLNPGGA